MPSVDSTCLFFGGSDTSNGGEHWPLVAEHEKETRDRRMGLSGCIRTSTYIPSRDDHNHVRGFINSVRFFSELLSA